MQPVIYHAIDSLSMGGGQTMLFELYDAIRTYYSSYHQVVVCLGGNLIDKKLVGSYNIPVINWLSRSKIIPHIRNHSTAVVIYHKLMRSNTSWYEPLLTHVPIIVLNHTHTKGSGHNQINACDAVVSVCNNMKKNLSRMGGAGPRHVVIHNSVNPIRFDAVNPGPRPVDNDTLLTGRINAFNKIKYSDSWLRFILDLKLPSPILHEYIGDGGYYKNAQQLLKKVKNQKRISLIGKIHRFEEKIRIMKNWDLFLYEINQDEGLSISVLEAMACGVPVVCSNHFGNKEIIKDGVNGYVFKNRQHCAEILKDLCRNRDKLLALRKTTRDYLEKEIGPDKMAKKYIDLINEVSSEEGRRADHSGVYPVSKQNVTKRRTDIVKIRKSKLDQSKKRTVKVNQKRKNIRVSRDQLKKKEGENGVESDEFTILTSAYNNAKYLKDWGESIKRQGYRPLSVVFVDDASNDDTKTIVEDIASDMEKSGIRTNILYNNKRLYCGGSYQKAFQQSTGYFMGVLDADDMLTPGSVEYIMELYKKIKDVGWIYTQFNNCNKRMEVVRRGFSSMPRRGSSLLDMGKNRKHCYSHWRTFSRRVPKLWKIWDPKLRASVDKFMGYRLEEWAVGMFANRVCYNYRNGVPDSISRKEPAVKIWHKVIAEAEKRRQKYNLAPHRIIEYQGP